MERFENKYGNIWYIFESKFNAIFDDNYLFIRKVHKDFKNNKLDSGAPNWVGPDIFIYLLPVSIIRHFSIRGHLPISASLEGEEVGYSNSNFGYEAADRGLGQRPIKKVICTFGATDYGFCLNLIILAGPIDEKTLDCQRNREETKDITDTFKIEIPFNDVPEVLNMDERTRRLFRRRNWNDNKSH